jgi:hypothetical protein
MMKGIFKITHKFKGRTSGQYRILLSTHYTLLQFIAPNRFSCIESTRKGSFSDEASNLRCTEIPASDLRSLSEYPE